MADSYSDAELMMMVVVTHAGILFIMNVLYFVSGDLSTAIRVRVAAQSVKNGKDVFPTRITIEFEILQCRGP
jgi:hypothetical protein